MSEYAVMPLTDYKDACDAIRAKTETSEPIKSGDMAENIPKVYEAGKQAEYDAFWDGAYYGITAEACYCDYRFAGHCWNDVTFNPTRGLTPTSAYGMFYDSRVVNPYACFFDEETGEQKLPWSTKNCENMSYFYRNCTRLVRALPLDITSQRAPVGLYYGCKKLVTAELTVREDGTNTFSNDFQSCTSLENLYINGTIGQNTFDTRPCVKLSKASHIRIMTALSTTTSGLSVTFSKEAVNNAFGINVDDPTTYPEGSEWYELRNSRSNWTISYV